jgi:hypothetical protein
MTRYTIVLVRVEWSASEVDGRRHATRQCLVVSIAPHRPRKHVRVMLSPRPRCCLAVWGWVPVETQTHGNDLQGSVGWRPIFACTSQPSNRRKGP